MTDLEKAISIHAPARGATTKERSGVYVSDISIHAPRGERHLIIGQINFLIFYFNPRSREGSDSATVHRSDGLINFNPRSREGSDSSPHCFGYYCILFQSTLPRGERHDHAGLDAGRGYFNPRSREGSDGKWPMSWAIKAISIHAPARGATLIDAKHALERGISIHAPARGATIAAC